MISDNAPNTATSPLSVRFVNHGTVIGALVLTHCNFLAEPCPPRPNPSSQSRTASQSSFQCYSDFAPVQARAIGKGYIADPDAIAHPTTYAETRRRRSKP
jgi:hypothetical protein